jgi:hypothetical protein
MVQACSTPSGTSKVRPDYLLIGVKACQTTALHRRVTTTGLRGRLGALTVMRFTRREGTAIVGVTIAVVAGILVLVLKLPATLVPVVVSAPAATAPGTVAAAASSPHPREQKTSPGTTSTASTSPVRAAGHPTADSSPGRRPSTTPHGTASPARSPSLSPSPSASPSPTRSPSASPSPRPDASPSSSPSPSPSPSPTGTQRCPSFLGLPFCLGK